MHRTLMAFALVGAASLAAPASRAEVQAPDSENGRYTFTQTPEGLLRLDGRTGHVSLCTKRVVGWSCDTVPDERAALEAEIARLQNENGTLKRELVTHGIPLPGGIKPGAAADAGPAADAPMLKLPSDADVDRAMGLLEKVWRRFLDMVQNLRRDADQQDVGRRS